MKRYNAMQPIVLKGNKAIEAAEDAVSRSIKNGKALQMFKRANAKSPLMRKSRSERFQPR